MAKTVDTITDFGEYTTNFMNKTIVLARVSKVYDVLNKINIDAKLVNRKIGEHTLAKQHLKYFAKGDLILYDRGYPSFDLFMKTLATGSHFCARLTVANWNVAKKLVESGQKEIIAEIRPGKELKRKYQKEGIVAEPIKCRFVCVELFSGEKEVLITSLLDTINYPYSLFKDLYHLRWDIEESYKKDKHRLQLENFSGKTIIAIYQDFYATILLANLTSIFSTSLADDIDKRTQGSSHKYQLNYTTALAKVKGIVALLFTRKNINILINKSLQMFLSNILPIRSGRSFARVKNKRKRYHKTYLPL